jgi:drug/metabolite transporter (DMT)-like permease
MLGRVGILNPGLAYALSLVGLTQITASLSVLLWATEPILILVLAAAVLGERIGPLVIVPSIAALAGVGLAVFDPGAAGELVGVVLTVAGVAVCATYTVATRRWLPGAADSTFGVVLAQQLHALAFSSLMLAAAAIGGWTILPATLSAGGISSAVISGLLYYAFAYLLYLTALRSLPASVAAASFYLIPIFGIASAWLFGERLQPLQWAGAIVVVASVFVITILGSRGAPSSAAAIGARSRAASA